MSKTLRRIWISFLAWNKERTIWAVLTGDEADHKSAFDHAFSSAKLLSDFVGMVVRVTFLAAATGYFYEKTRSTEGLENIVFSYTALMTFLIAIRLSSRIVVIVFLYQSRDIINYDHIIGRIISFVFSVFFTAAIWWSGYALVRDLAKATSVVP